MTSAKYSGQANESFAYDALGNRQGTVISPHNRVLSDARFRYGYDNEGNLTRKTELATGEVTEYAFDLRNLLTHAVRHSAGGITLSDVAYRYDASGRLIERNVNGVVLRSNYDGVHAWSDADASGTIQARYLFGDKIDGLLGRWQPANGSAWYLTDHLGTVRQIINGAGAAVLNAVEYSAFGEIMSQTNPAAGDRFAFTGREWEAAAGLYYYRARFYDAASGRFVSQDPIGFLGGDANLYRYVGNVPTMRSDPHGLADVAENAVIDAKVIARARFALSRTRGNNAASALRAQIQKKLETIFSELSKSAYKDAMNFRNIQSQVSALRKLLTDINTVAPPNLFQYFWAWIRFGGI